VDEEWGRALNLEPPFDEINDAGALCVSPDGKYMFFTECFRKDSHGSCDLYFSKKNGDKWTDPKNLGPDVNSDNWDSQASISPDGKTLYFASNRQGGYGSSDIWKAELIAEEKWGNVQNVGRTINTAGMEMTPFMHFDGQSLYFASDGHVGMGGMDLFKTLLDESQWSVPENLGFPLNTDSDEIGLVISALGNTAYISADRPEGIGKYDIYSFLLPETIRPDAVTYLKGVVFDSISRDPLEADIELIDLEKNVVVMQSRSDKLSGDFLICIPSNRDYMLNVERKSYLFYSDNFSLKGIYTYEEPFEQNIPLQPIMPGSSVVLNNVFFDVDSSRLKTESFIELDKLVTFMKDNPSVSVEIGGHTDNTGTKAYNIELSSNRAASVVKYLMGSGIDPDRIISKGYGFDNPVSTNDTEEGKSLNRRTEAKIISVK